MAINPCEQGRVDGAFETQRDRSRHDHVPVLAPGDIEKSAVELDDYLASGEPPPVRPDERGAGAAAAGAGDPGAALPYPQPDLPTVADRSDADIRALGKQRVMFEDGAERREIDRLDIFDEKGRVRISYIGANRRRERAER